MAAQAFTHQVDHGVMISLFPPSSTHSVKFFRLLPESLQKPAAEAASGWCRWDWAPSGKVDVAGRIWIHPLNIAGVSAKHTPRVRAESLPMGAGGAILDWGVKRKFLSFHSWI